MKLRKHLQAYLQQLHPEWQGITISKLLKMPAGWETDLYAFNLSYQQDSVDTSHSLVLRVYPGEDASETPRHEFNGMQLLHEVGYPVPRVYGLESQPSPSGKAFLIMERIPGEAMGSIIGKSTPQVQAALITQLCELFVRLHNLDWRHFTSDPQSLEAGGTFIFTDNWITNARHGLEKYEKFELIPILDWIIQHRDEMRTEKPSVVHQDFHPNNILLRADGSAVVIDWSSWQVMDYRFDVAWTLMLAHAYVGEGMRLQILNTYERIALKRAEGIRVFEVCACFRRLLDVMTSLSHGAESRGMRPQAVEVMRSQMEELRRVYELLQEHSGIHITEVETLLDS
jgi:aminoglycoside phosphotransferase (APT) family kinase protein